MDVVAVADVTVSDASFAAVDVAVFVVLVVIVVVAVVGAAAFVAHSSCAAEQVGAGVDGRNGASEECFGLVLWCSWCGWSLMRSTTIAICLS